MNDTRLQDIRYYRYSLRRWWFLQTWSGWWSLRTSLGRGLDYLWPDDVSAWHVAFFAGCVGLLLTLLLFLEPQETIHRHWLLNLSRPGTRLAAATEPEEPRLDTRWPLETIAAGQDYLAEFRFGTESRRQIPERANVVPQRTIVREPLSPDRDPEPVAPRRLEIDDRRMMPSSSELTLNVATWHYVPSVDESRADARNLQLKANSSLSENARSQLALRRVQASPGWNLHATTDRSQTKVRRYVDRATLVGQSLSSPWQAEPDRQHPSYAEIAFDVEAGSTDQVAPHEAGESTVVITNRSSGVLGEIEIREPLDAMPTITDAMPAALLNGRVLVRRLAGFAPQSREEMQLKWHADRSGETVHRAIVVATAAVYAAMQVEAPAEVPRRSERPAPRVEPARREVVEEEREPEPVTPKATVPEAAPRIPDVKEETPRELANIELRVNHRGTVRVGEVTLIQIEVYNPNDHELNEVMLTADLGEEVEHRQGDKIELPLGALAARARRTTTLRVKGHKVGDAANRIAVSSSSTRAAVQQMVLIVQHAEAATPPANAVMTPAVAYPLAPCGCRTGS